MWLEEMVNPSDFQSTLFESNPLPDNARNAVYDGLHSRGFTQSSIKRDYSFSLRDGRRITPNILAFAHEMYRRPDYTSLTVFNPANGADDQTLVQGLAQCAAPFHLIHRPEPDRFSFWFSNVRDRTSSQVELQLIAQDIDHSQLARVFDDYAADLNPRRIVDVKQGRDVFRHFAHTGPFQLTLWAIEATGDLLVTHFGQVVERLSQYALSSPEVTDLAIQLLGATILAHTGNLSETFRQRDPSIDSLITSAYETYPNYFTPQLFNQWHDAATSGYNILRQLRYSNFSPELLTQLYRAAYPDIEQRRSLGRYDTPLYLTRRILESIPIEFLPPHQRILADMTCGWGSFLIAGYERMSRMIDMQGLLLREYIFGNDKDRFTARLAGLGLLVSTLQDRWQIDFENALTWSGPDPRPNIIVGNPPFGGNRKTLKSGEGEEASRIEQANQFLDHAIDLLEEGGYLAMLMPQSFVAAEASPRLRRKLLETCDVWELWELPIGVFPDAQANSLVLFAQKKQYEQQSVLANFPTRIRNVQTEQLRQFEEGGPFTVSSLVKDQSRWNEESRRSRYSKNTNIMDYRLILTEHEWQRVHSVSVPLNDVATIIPGTIRGSVDRRHHASVADNKLVNWLTQVRNVIHDSFQITYHNPQQLTYPNDFEWPRLKSMSLFDGPKVLFNAIANPSWGKRVKAVIERRGYHVSDNFIIVVPKDNNVYHKFSLEVIAAVIDWKVTNAWILEYLGHAKIPMRAIRSIPFPVNLSGTDCAQITKAVLEIEQAWTNKIPSSQTSWQTIDTILRAAYDLDDETYNRLAMVEAWDANSPTTLDQQFDANARWHISGVVDSLDVESGTITLWVDGFGDLQTVPIIPVMPGWLLRPETNFRTSIPRACVRRRSLKNNTSWGYFYPQDYTYLSEEELFDQLQVAVS
jgi:hypothetical protein